ncbi:TetR/AcrR family transcriptional regulator [Pseudoteredinibacter isoporae]|uniref:AcrR family transcriptional regulator n=1 Tax=Pseudoteredinibacter isoporae TaxID=570281 RepID=A0A7X0MXR6_9GAMM|nr:TetR/AcrR family transcriptional regulator [Pseudoteredinibacter isoporae]MBB6522274.1 AcrR family transcriptional regulator [Pseudoteredinibacter isoporae]NHO87807.1 TetR/AcrR family transcriptional regulator [Pseudoteredinibacter isoporae]NIB23862.1 TetR/AcrR family transcriptional regulator [Pseudoteredinibacter isoporae]
MSKESKSDSPNKSRPRRHENLPEKLLLAAEEILEENGLEGFSLRAVARRAGATHGAPAHHFGDSSGLLTALAADGYRRLLGVQQARQSTAENTPLAQLTALGLGYVDFAIQHPTLFRLMFSSERPRREDPYFAEASMEVFNLLAEKVMQVSGKNSITEPEFMPSLMASWSMVHGLAELVISGRAEGPLGFIGKSDVEREKVILAVIGKVDHSSE